MSIEKQDPPLLVSIIIPVYNEIESVPILYDELTAALSDLEQPYELVFVNDGSKDGSAELLDKMADEDSHVTVVHFRRNYGQTAAMMAGMDHAQGEILVPIDADLQNDPADIPKLIAKLDEGYDVVSGWRKDRKDKFLSRRLPSQCANWLISKISGVSLHDYGCSLKAYRREYMEDVRLYGEMHRFIPIYANMHGGKVIEIVVNHRPRVHGTSKYGLGRIFKVLLDLMFVKFLASYQVKPIYLFGGFGFLCLVASIFPIGLSIYFKVMPVDSGWHKDFVETPLPVIGAVLILIGFIAFFQGLLAEMLMRTYFESQGKLTYSVRSVRRATVTDEKNA